MTDKEILEYALAAYEKAAEEKWHLGKLEKEEMELGGCWFLQRKLNIPYEETARILKIGGWKKCLCSYPYKLSRPLDGIIYRRDYLRKLLND